MDQQSDIDPHAGRISKEAIQRGFETIAENISREQYSDTIIKDLQRTKRCDFTIRHIYATVFKFTQPAAVNKVRSWEDTGAVHKLGTIQETEGAKGSYHYGVANMLLAKHVFAEVPIAEFIPIKTRICPNCQAVLIRDWDLRSPQFCHACQQEVS